MSINSTEIEKIAWLARLTLPQDDIPANIAEMSRVLELVDQMNSIDTGTIEPLAHPME